VAGDRRDLVRRAANLRKPPRGGLAQPVRGHVGTIGRVTLLPEPIAETGRGVRLAEMRDEERLDANRGRRVDYLPQLRMHRDFQMRFLAAVRLALSAAVAARLVPIA
jgi:hypothetical protein